jgi:poly(ADP-ribose) glycohydrolase ARH3
MWKRAGRTVALMSIVVVGCAGAPLHGEPPREERDAREQAPSLDARIEGAVIGAVVGDALGKGVEGFGLKPETQALIPASYLAGNVVHMVERDGRSRFPDALPQPPGTYTDDSEEMSSLLLSLVQTNGRVDQLEMVRQLTSAYRREHWYSDGTMSLIDALSALPDKAAWRTVTLAPERNRTTYESNGCAMRISPIGLVALGASDTELRAMVTAACEITHPAPISTEGAIVIAKATQLALRDPHAGKFDRGAFLDGILGVVRMSPHLDDPAVALLAEKLDHARALLAEVEQLRRTSPANADLRETEALRDPAFLGVGFKITDCIPGTVYFAARYIDDYKAGMNRAIQISLPGDTDTIPAMAGAVIGAYLGIDAVPRGWVAQLYETRADGAASDAWLEQWSDVWHGEGLSANQVPAHFDLRFMPLTKFRQAAHQLADIVRARH